MRSVPKHLPRADRREFGPAGHRQRQRRQSTTEKLMDVCRRCRHPIMTFINELGPGQPRTPDAGRHRRPSRHRCAALELAHRRRENRSKAPTTIYRNRSISFPRPMAAAYPAPRGHRRHGTIPNWTTCSACKPQTCAIIWNSWKGPEIRFSSSAASDGALTPVFLRKCHQRFGVQEMLDTTLWSWLRAPNPAPR